MINPHNTTSWDTWSIVISQLHEIQHQSSKFNFLRSVINTYNSTSWDWWSIFITQLLDIYDEFSYWPWISWSYAMRTDHESHEVAWWGLTMDLMKLSYEDRSWISLSCVLRIDQRYHEVELWGLIIDLMKFSPNDWSRIS